MKLLGIHPVLAEKIGTILAQMELLGHPMRVCQGLRTVAQQQALYAEGRTLPGRKITNCDGVVRKSRHQVASDGWGHAVDCCFSGSDPFGIKQPWSLYGAQVRAQGLTWGGDFSSPVDLDHAELPLS